MSLQKRLHRSRCSLGFGLELAKVTMSQLESRYPQGKVNFEQARIKVGEGPRHCTTIRRPSVPHLCDLSYTQCWIVYFCRDFISTVMSLREIRMLAKNRPIVQCLTSIKHYRLIGKRMLKIFCSRLSYAPSTSQALSICLQFPCHNLALILRGVWPI